MTKKTMERAMMLSSTADAGTPKNQLKPKRASPPARRVTCLEVRHGQAPDPALDTPPCGAPAYQLVLLWSKDSTIPFPRARDQRIKLATNEQEGRALYISQAIIYFPKHMTDLSTWLVCLGQCRRKATIRPQHSSLHNIISTCTLKKRHSKCSGIRSRSLDDQHKM